MKIRFTRRAFDQLSAIRDYIDERSPTGAETVKRRINAAIAMLEDHPHSARMTARPGLRRIVTVPYPYLIVYRPAATEVVIHSIRHAARRPRG